MDPISGTNGSQQSQSSSSASNSLQGLSTDDFLTLMLAQLQNQDPLNPTDNNALMQQISSIKDIGATDKLTSTLDSVLLGQNLTSATSMIGKQVYALSDDNQQIAGTVDYVSVTGGEPKLQIGSYSVSLKNVMDILPTPAI